MLLERYFYNHSLCPFILCTFSVYIILCCKSIIEVKRLHANLLGKRGGSNSATVGKEDQSWKSGVSKMLRKRQSGKDLGRNAPNIRNSWYKDFEIKDKIWDFSIGCCEWWKWSPGDNQAQMGVRSFRSWWGLNFILN